MNRRLVASAVLLVLLCATFASAQVAAPVVGRDARVAVVGDSITEQKLYSRYIELYLLACQPQLQTTSMQFGWGGEWAAGFANRMDNDLMPFKPTVVTLCYGMNDGQYRAYEESIGKRYGDPLRDIVKRLKAAGVTVVVGGPGVVDAKTFRNDPAQALTYNDNLRQLSEIARGIATEAGMPFADVHGAMMDAMTKAKAALGVDFQVAGGDGVHPGADGHLVMAYAFLKAMGFDGNLGTITVDLKGKAEATGGHRVLSDQAGVVELESTRYPFCFFGAPNDSNGTRSILPFVPFNQDLNRLTLIVKNLGAEQGQVTWGKVSKTFARADLEKGINLAAEFLDNPFSETWNRLDGAVGNKESFETFMIKNQINGFPWLTAQFKDDPTGLAALDGMRTALWNREVKNQNDLRALIVPIKHTLTVAPAPTAGG
ncbi:MAG TPA: SGNH/GDSL hydrolase family protein [Armatimonadota bacterium]|jgi:lysophospholipase L1-like esterase